jgi:co-chaperonin GroES (HSP10)
MKINPLKDKILISDMEFGIEKTKTGIILHSDDGKLQGIHPRWGRVYAVGPEQTDVNVGQWICIEHGRWTRSWKFKQEDGDELELRGVDNKAIMLVSDDKPEDVMRAA